MDRPQRDDPKPKSGWLPLLLAAGVGIMILTALVMLTGGFLGLVIVVGGGVFALAGFHYLVWGWWLSDKLYREEAEAERQSVELAQRRALLPAGVKAAAGPLWMIFWGLAISVVALKINGAEVPWHHAIAFGLITWGCFRLASESVHFAVAAVLSGIIAGWWLLGPLIRLPPQAYDAREVVFLLALFYSLLNCGMVWEMLGGMREFSLAGSRPDLAAKASSRRIVYAVVMTGCLLAGKLLLYDRETFPTYLAVGGALIATAMILQLIYRVQAELT